MYDFCNKTFNCDNREVFLSLPDDSIDLINTDPPYKDYQSNRPIAHGKVRKINHCDFDLPFFLEQSARVLKPNSHFYCWCDHYSFPDIYKEIKSLEERMKSERSKHYLIYKNCLIWVKNNHGSGDLKSNYAPQHEFIIFASKGKAKPLNGKRQPNVYFQRTGEGIKFYKKVSNYNFHHGTTKPVDILRLMILASSQLNDLVFDPYAGSMSLGEACLLEKRKYLLVEIDDNHYHNGLLRLKRVAKDISNI